MRKQYIAPQIVETEIYLRSCICSGISDGIQTNNDPTVVGGGEAPMRKINYFKF